MMFWPQYQTARSGTRSFCAKMFVRKRCSPKNVVGSRLSPNTHSSNSLIAVQMYVKRAKRRLKIKLETCLGHLRGKREGCLQIKQRYLSILEAATAFVTGDRVPYAADFVPVFDGGFVAEHAFEMTASP